MTDSDFRAVHIRVYSNSNVHRFSGSKYVQSDLGHVCGEVQSDLLNDKYVLFSGTSCQIAGLKAFLHKANCDVSKLYTVDIVCHGVPSPRIWKDYIRYIEETYKSNVQHADFRNKRDFGWADHVESFRLKNGKCINTSSYTALFYRHFTLRPACHQCPYKSTQRISDISLADFWGVNKVIKLFNDNKGVSAVLINSEKGKNVFEMIKDNLIWKEVDIENCMQTALRAPFAPNKERDNFWNQYYLEGFSAALFSVENVKKDYLIHNLLPKKIYLLIKKITLRNKM